MAARSRCRVAWWQVDMWDAVVRGNWRFLEPAGPSMCTYRSSSAPEMRGRRRRSIFSRAAARAVAETLLRLNGGLASDKQASETDDADDAVCIATLEADTTWSVGVFEAAQGRFIGTHFRSGRFLHETHSTTRLGL